MRRSRAALTGAALAALVGAGLLGLAVQGVERSAGAPAPVAAPDAAPPVPSSPPGPVPSAAASPPAAEQSAPAKSSPDMSARDRSAREEVEVVRAGTGRLSVVPGTTRRSGEGPVQRYRVEVEGGLGIDPEEFAAAVDRTLADPRSWGADGRLSFRRVDSGSVRFRVVLASPRTTDRLCRPYDTEGRYSCGLIDRAVINSARWLRGADAYTRPLAEYRQYVVNHEVGHALDHRHEPCPGAGRRAPVMLQQTISLRGCRPNPWPYP